MGNILGEPFKKYVDKQIKKRQEIHGKVDRTTEEISYLNSTNAWIKLASGVSLTQERLNLLKNEYGNPLVTTTNPGKELAMKNVLFNGVTSMGGTNLVNTPGEDLNAREFLDFMGKDNNEKEYYNQQQRTDFLGPNGAYGMGGNDFGIVPMPGIVSMDSQDLNRGSIKKTRIKLKAYNKNQFDVLDVLYLRLGYTVLLEFGNNRYWDSGDEIKQGTNTLTSMGPTLIDQEFFQTDEDYYNLLIKIEKLRKEKRGNYDAILGKIQNFSWTFAPDGTYDIDLDIISIGDVIESLKVNLPPFGIDPNRAKERQLVRNKFKNREARDINDLNEIYPGIKDLLTNWYQNTLTSNTINLKAYFGQLPQYNEGYPRKSYNDRLVDGENVLSNLDFKIETDRSQAYYNGNLSIFNYPSLKDFNNLDELGKNNISYYLKEAIKYAIIIKVNGYYGGDGFLNPLNSAVLIESPDKDDDTSRPATGDVFDSRGGSFLDPRKYYLVEDDGYTYKKNPLVANNETLNTAFNKYENFVKNRVWYSTSDDSTSGIVGTEAKTSIVNSLEGGIFKLNERGFKDDKTQAKFGFPSIGGGTNTFTFNNTPQGRHSALNAMVYPDIASGLFDDYSVPNQSNQPGQGWKGLNGSNDDVIFLKAQQNLLKNIPQNEFLQLVVKFFQEVEAAGGAQDNQFSDDPEYASFSQELEYEKSRNRIYSWFYKVRKYYTGIVITDDNRIQTDIGEQSPGEKFGDILMEHKLEGNNFTSRKIGYILNPYEVSTKAFTGSTEGLSQRRIDVLTAAERKSFLKKWNERVGFPTYTDQYANIDLVVLDKVGDNEFNLDPRFKYFVRLKTLLEFVEKRIIPQIIPSQNNNTIPLIKIDTDSNSNICYAIDNMMSSDIRSCIIRNDNVYTTTGRAKLFNNLDLFFPPKPINGYIYGRPMNIYMNFEFVQTTIDSLVGNSGEAALFDFLKKICNEINKCLGYVNNLEPTIDYETNTIKIIDQTPIPGIEEIAAGLTDDFGRKVYRNFSVENPAVLEVYGYNPTNKQSNFVHNIGLTTGISKRYASMITIGATANGSVPGSEATAFSKWNIGVIDRVKPEIIDPESDQNTLTLEQQNQGVIESYGKLLTNVDFERNFYKLIQLNSNGTLEPEYLKTQGSVTENFYKFAQAKFSQSGSLESSVGFLPFNLKIDMEGLSGIKIYNRIHVNTRFLPSNYPQTLDFIVTKVNHKVESNKWDTTLETQATRILKKDNEGNIIDTPKLYNDPQIKTILKSTIQEQKDAAVPPPDKYTGKNGNIPDSELQSLAPIGFPNRKLAKEGGAADNFIKMWKDMAAKGIKLPTRIGEDGAYRDYEGQYNLFDIDRYISTGGKYVKNTKNTACAFPGTSNHGLGKAIDIGGRDKKFQKMRCFIRENGAKYGWGWKEGQRIDEPWHFTYYGFDSAKKSLVDDSGYKGKSPCK